MAMARVLCAAHRLCDALVIVVADCWHKVDVHTCVQWVVVVQFILVSPFTTTYAVCEAFANAVHYLSYTPINSCRKTIGDTA